MDEMECTERTEDEEGSPSPLLSEEGYSSKHSSGWCKIKSFDCDWHRLVHTVDLLPPWSKSWIHSSSKTPLNEMILNPPRRLWTISRAGASLSLHVVALLLPNCVKSVAFCSIKCHPTYQKYASRCRHQYYFNPLIFKIPSHVSYILLCSFLGLIGPTSLPPLRNWCTDWDSASTTINSRA